MTTTEYELWCFVPGIPNTSEFNVNIPASETVSHLRDVIYRKIENRVLGIGSTSLALWKVGSLFRVPKHSI